MPSKWDHAWCTEPYDVLSGVYKCDPARHEYSLKPIRLRNLAVGPQPNDWRFSWETCEEEWAGLFWGLIEGSAQQEDMDSEDATPQIPGSWVD